MAFNKRSLVAALVPLVFACELLLPEQADLHLGVGEALGCSGSGSTAPPMGFSWVKPRLAQGLGVRTVPIATDGFFTIDADGYMVSRDAALAGVRIVVKDEQDAVVAGETKLLSDGGSGSHYLFGWSASSALAVGAKLRANVSATPVAPSAAPENLGGEFELEVVGEPTPLPTPAFLFTAWFDYYRGQPGATLTCAVSTPPGGCSSATAISVPASVEKQLEAQATWRPPTFTSGVAWTVKLEASPGQTNIDLSNLYLGNEYVGVASSATGTLDLGRVVYPHPAERYCATLVITDLRTKQESRAETCALPQAPQSADSDTKLGSCDQSPSPALTEAWCRLKQGSSSFPECVALAGGMGGAGGTGGTGGTGGAIGRGGSVSSGGYLGGTVGGAHDNVPPDGGYQAPGIGGSGAVAVATHDADDGPHTSKGCQLGGGSSRSNRWLLAALGMGLAVRRRRSAGRSVAA